jgi:hypothetical protein
MFKIVSKKKQQLFMWGRSRCKRGLPDLPEFAASRLQIFARVDVLILYLFTTVKDFADFSSPYRSSTHKTLSV